MVKKEEINMTFTKIKKAAKMKALKAYNWVDEHKGAIKAGGLIVGGAVLGGYIGRKKGRDEGIEAGQKFQCSIDEMYIDNLIKKDLIVENYDHNLLEAKDAYYEKVEAANKEVDDYIKAKLRQ